jgi:hypothetical protein
MAIDFAIQVKDHSQAIATAMAVLIPMWSEMI